MRLLKGVVLFGGLLVAAACAGPSSDDDESGEGAVTVVDGLEAPGVLVMRTADGFSLFDPRSATVSQLQYPVRVGDAHLDVSPDGTRLVHVTPNGAVVVSRLVDDGGAPSLEQVQAWEGLTAVNLVRFNPHGDRVTTGNQWLNVETGDVVDCALSNPPPGDQRVIPLPDGYGFFCDGARYHDAEPITETVDPRDLGFTDLYDVVIAPSLDGQFDSPMWLSDPLRFRGIELRPEAAYRAHLDGSQWFAESARNGTFLVSEAGNAGGPVPQYICRTETSAAMATDSRQTRYHDNLAAGAVDEPGGIWPLLPALQRFYVYDDGADSRDFASLAQHPESDAVLYQVTSFVMNGAACSNDVVDTYLVLIDRDGGTFELQSSSAFDDLRTVAASELRSAHLRSVFAGYGMVPYAAEGFLLPASGLVRDGVGSWQGFIGRLDGAVVRVPGRILGPEGARTWDVRQLDGAGNVVCATRVDDPGRTRCVSYPYAGEPLAVVGEGVMSSDTLSAPVVRSLSHVSRATGATLSIRGAGFGTGGEVRVGDHVVASSEATTWTDRHIDVVVTDAWPDRGTVSVVVDGAASGEGGLARWVGRTPAVTTPVDDLTGAFTLRQGITPIDVGPDRAGMVVDRTPVDADGLLWIFSPGVAESITVRRLLNIDNAWLVWPRVTTEPGLADGTVWQPVLATNQPVGEGATARGFATMAGDHIDMDGPNRIGTDGDRVVFEPVFQTALSVPNPFGVPSMYRDTPAGTFSFDRVFLNQATRIDGWSPSGDALRADVAPMGCDPGLQDFGAAGDLVVATGGDLRFGAIPAAHQISVDGGATWAPMVTEGSPQLRAPAGLLSADGPVVLAFESSAEDGSWVPWFVDGDGARPADVAVADRALVDDLRSLWRTYTADGSAAIYYRPGSTQALVVDLADTAPAVGRLDVGGDLRSLVHDSVAGRLYATLTDGTVRVADFDGPTPTFEAVDLTPTLSDGTELDPTHAWQLDDGRWLIRGEADALPAWGESFAWFAVSPAVD